MALLVVLLAACAPQISAADIEATSAAATTPTPSTPPDLHVTITAHDIYWEPDHIEAQVGQTIVLTLHNEGALDHDFVIESLDIDELPVELCAAMDRYYPHLRRA